MNRFARIFNSLTGGVRTAREHLRLDRMSDRQLADIGLTREGISRRALKLARSR
jgi:uncharacterized protein YjiS (DUF1127 family)